MRTGLLPYSLVPSLLPLLQYHLHYSMNSLLLPVMSQIVHGSISAA